MAGHKSGCNCNFCQNASKKGVADNVDSRQKVLASKLQKMAAKKS